MTIAPSDWPIQLIQILADDIGLAHKNDPRSWAIYTYREWPVFGVGMMTVLTLRNDMKVTMLVNIAYLNPSQRDALQRATGADIQGDGYFHANVDQTFLFDNLDWLLPAHQAEIRRLAVHLSARWKWHRQDMLEQFSQKLGVSLPSPRYPESPDQPRDPGSTKTDGPPQTTGVPTPRSISSRFTANGLTYSNTQIADFYTALQTKGFVVLSGISGTGKSKIAQHFTELLPDAYTSKEVTQAGDDTIALKLMPYMTAYSRAIIPNQYTHLLPPVRVGESIATPISYEGRTFPCRLHRERGQLYRVFWRKDFNERLRIHPEGVRFDLEPLYGSDDTIIEKFALTFPHATSADITEKTSNSKFLSVRPDWRDSTTLLGYYNPLTERYEWTDFLRFILSAVENYQSDEQVAWFVILDEMNLAHVEYYFADLLSVLESGRDENGMTMEPLRLTYPDDLASEVPQHEIYLPPNLYIIGTVNMDETTHAFSPKVLDRAFTMELTDVDFSTYPATPSSTQSAITAAEKRSFLVQFSQDFQFHGIRKPAIAQYVASYPEVRSLLHTLNTGLAEHRFQFGYRVFDEIVQFLANAEANGMYDDWWTALDSAAYMKILPKFSGSEARIGEPLRVLIDWSNDPEELGLESPRLPRLYRRAQQMQHQLEIDGFVTAF